MFGRSVLSLLVLVSVFVSSPLLNGQAHRDSVSHSVPRFATGPASHQPSRSQPTSELVPLVPRFPVSPPVPPGLSQIARAAGMIFWGTVSHIERRPSTRGQSVETVAITFHIENAIRGVTPGENLTILQWIGLWSNGQRYRIGERVLLFLYPRSKLGLTSVVAGPRGRFAVDPGGRVLLPARHFSVSPVDARLGGKSRVLFSDFALAVRQACEEE
jgi:hypothetical protein